MAGTTAVPDVLHVTQATVNAADGPVELEAFIK